MRLYAAKTLVTAGVMVLPGGMALAAYAPDLFAFLLFGYNGTTRALQRQDAGATRTQSLAPEAQRLIFSCLLTSLFIVRCLLRSARC